MLITWATLMRLLAGTWLQPAAFFSLWWCFAGILPLIFAADEPVGANAMIWVIAASVAVSLGAIVGNGGFKTKLNTGRAAATDRELLVFGLIVIMSIVLGMLSNLLFVSSTDVALSDLFDVQKLIVASNQFYVQRFGDTPPSPPLLSQAFLPFVYLAPAAGGILFVLRREWRWKLSALATFIPALGVTVLQTTKAAVLFAMTLWLSGYFAARLRQGKLTVFTRSHITVAATTVVIVTLLFFATSFARLASTDAAMLNIVIAKLVGAAFGHMSVFSQWLTDYWNQPFDPSLGTVTFAGPLELLGYSRRIPGVFEQVISLVLGEMSNIYTAFRPLIQDFTIPGALTILALLGLVGGAGFRMVASGSWSGVPLLLIAYLTIMWTPITWLWFYNSLSATVVAMIIVVLGIRIWRGRGRAVYKAEGLVAN